MSEGTETFALHVTFNLDGTDHRFGHKLCTCTLRLSAIFLTLECSDRNLYFDYSFRLNARRAKCIQSDYQTILSDTSGRRPLVGVVRLKLLLLMSSLKGVYVNFVLALDWGEENICFACCLNKVLVYEIF